jgi:hypothetical protein
MPAGWCVVQCTASDPAFYNILASINTVTKQLEIYSGHFRVMIFSFASYSNGVVKVLDHQQKLGHCSTKDLPGLSYMF